jgi:Zn-dependent protease
MTTPRVPPQPKTLFHLAGTPVQADASAPLSAGWLLGLCWLLIGERYPAYGVARRGLLSLIWLGLGYGVFFVHSLGHVLSSRAIGAPMDVLVINAVHWVTLYFNNGVDPQAHLGRAAGGPVANALAMLVTRRLRPVIPVGPLGRDLLDTFFLFNAALLAAALLPTPSFDGGALLKWTAYSRSGDLQRAAQTVQKAGLGAAGLLGGLGGVALLLGRRLSGMILAAFGLVAALESLRRD